MRNLCILGGNSHPALVESICKQLAVPVGKATLTKFANNETNVNIDETVREIDTFIIQSGCGNVNDNFMEMLIMISACRTSSARKITAVIPCFPYSRQSDNIYHPEMPISPVIGRKRDLSRVQKMVIKEDVALSSGDSDAVPIQLQDYGPPSPISEVRESVASVTESLTPSNSNRARLSSISVSQPNIEVTNLSSKAPKNKNGYKQWTAKPGTLICNMLVAAGCDHVITMDLHDPQFQGFFDIPVDNLFSTPLILKYIREHYPEYKDATIVSPDAGGAKRATAIADKLNVDFALIHKERYHQGPRGSEMMLVGDVKGKFCIIVDDMTDTADTLCSASQVLKEKGATRCIAIITHGILSGDALFKIKNSFLEHVVVSNTVPQTENMRKCNKIKVMDVAIIFSEAIRRIHNGESVSFLADVVPY